MVASAVLGSFVGSRVTESGEPLETAVSWAASTGTGMVMEGGRSTGCSCRSGSSAARCAPSSSSWPGRPPPWPGGRSGWWSRHRMPSSAWAAGAASATGCGGDREGSTSASGVRCRSVLRASRRRRAADAHGVPPSVPPFLCPTPDGDWQRLGAILHGRPPARRSNSRTRERRQASTTPGCVPGRGFASRISCDVSNAFSDLHGILSEPGEAFASDALSVPRFGSGGLIWSLPRWRAA